MKDINTGLYMDTEDTILIEISLPDKMNYIFLDEIQHVSEYQKAVDSLFIRKNVDLYITGSNAYFMSGELATLLSGRYIELRMLPMSFYEYCEGIKKILMKIGEYLISEFPAKKENVNELPDDVIIKP